MNIRNFSFFIVMALCIGPFCNGLKAISGPIDYVIEPPQGWVDFISDDKLPSTPSQDAPSGVHYLLIDKQTKIEGNTILNFVHVVKKIMSRRGVRNAAHIEFEYKPLSESLSLHHIT